MDSMFIKAYQAYQEQNYDHSLKLLQEVRASEYKSDLLAQVHLQKREYQQAYDILSDLLVKPSEYAKERKENLSLVVVCSELEQPGVLKFKSNEKRPTEDDILSQVELINLHDDAVCEILKKPEPVKKTKKQKKRKQRLPKNYDPVAGPDPERWLPRRDRKGKQGKKRRQRPNASRKRF